MRTTLWRCLNVMLFSSTLLRKLGLSKGDYKNGRGRSLMSFGISIVNQSQVSLLTFQIIRGCFKDFGLLIGNTCLKNLFEEF